MRTLEDCSDRKDEDGEDVGGERAEGETGMERVESTTKMVAQERAGWTEHNRESCATPPDVRAEGKEKDGAQVEQETCADCDVVV